MVWCVFGLVRLCSEAIGVSGVGSGGRLRRWHQRSVDAEAGWTAKVLGPLPWLVIREAVAAAIPARTLVVRRRAACAGKRNDAARSAFAG